MNLQFTIKFIYKIVDDEGNHLHVLRLICES